MVLLPEPSAAWPNEFDMVERFRNTGQRNSVRRNSVKSSHFQSLGIFVFGLLLLGLLLGRAPGQSNPAESPAPPLVPAPAHRLPNEMGLVPILMYHAVGGEPEFTGGPRYDKHGLNIAPQTLRRQLRQMYDAGWYPVNMRDLLTARLAVPRGKTPVVLTFDDARPSQFRYLPDGRIDPNCAVGILEAFHQAHLDWPCRATFYVLPESKYNGVPFDQDGLETSKLRFLVRHGYELGNHTTSHRSLADMSRKTLRWEMATSVRYFRRRVPQATLTTMALPYGIAPRDKSRWRDLLAGSQGADRYRNRCLLLARGGPSFAFADARFNCRQVPRVEAVPGRIEQWIARSSTGAAGLYVSDGDPATLTVPQSALRFLDRHRLTSTSVVVSSPPDPPSRS